MQFTHRILTGLCTLALTFPLVAQLAVAEPAIAQSAEPRVDLQGVEISPENPVADTLCQLWVTIRNGGQRHASAFDFSVKVADQELPVYGNHTFLFPVAPGESRRIRLFNFWSSETGRAFPADGNLKVEVTLLRAGWFDRSDTDDEITWTFAGDVDLSTSETSASVSGTE